MNSSKTWLLPIGLFGDVCFQRSRQEPPDPSPRFSSDSALSAASSANSPGTRDYLSPYINKSNTPEPGISAFPTISRLSKSISSFHHHRKARNEQNKSNPHSRIRKSPTTHSLCTMSLLALSLITLLGYGLCRLPPCAISLVPFNCLSQTRLEIRVCRRPPQIRA